MDKEKNFQQRLWFVRYWANYVRTHSNADWSKQQKNMIDSVFMAANQDRELYLKVKSKARLQK